MESKTTNYSTPRSISNRLQELGLSMPATRTPQGTPILGAPPTNSKRSTTGNHYEIFTPPTSPKGVFVLVHGLGDFSIRYALMAPALVKAGFTVATFDFIGRGFSSSQQQKEQRLPLSTWDIRSHVAQLESVVTAANVDGKQDVHIVAHSMGGCIATYFAAQYPTRLNSLVLMAPAGAMAPGPLNCSSCGYNCLQCCCGTVCGWCAIPLAGKLTHKKYKAKGFVGGGVGGNGGSDPTHVLAPDQIAMGPALAEWDVAWILASAHHNGSNEAVMGSAVRLPLMDVLSAAKKDTMVDLTALKNRQLPVLLLRGADDMVVKGIRYEMYLEMFGTGNVSFEMRPGGHNFFIQDHANVVARCVEWVDAVKTKTVGRPNVAGDFCR